MCAHSRGLHEWVTHGVNEFTPFFAPLSRDLSSLSITVISEAKRTGSRRQVSQSNSTLRMILGDGSGVRTYIRTVGELGEGGTAIKNRVGLTGRWSTASESRLPGFVVYMRGEVCTLSSTCYSVGWVE